MRRTIVGVALLSVTALTASPACATESHGGRFDRPHQGFAPSDTVLRNGSPEDVGLNPKPIDSAQRRLAAWAEKAPDRPHPMYGGAVSLLAHEGVVVNREAVGHELRYANAQGDELPAHQQEPMRKNTIFDIASITKLFTSIAVLQQVEAGNLRLDAPVAEYMPEFAANGKEGITVQQLLTHTSGLPAEVQLWKLPPEQRIPSVLALAPEKPPGTAYKYSDPNMIALGVLLERITGKPLDTVVHDRIVAPLGLRDTGYRPPAEKRDRIATTEDQSDPARGMVRGQVHDENAWSLGGVAGQAGIFSTADDLAVLGQTLLNGGTYASERILSARSVNEMLTNYTGSFPGNAHGLGFELDQRWYMAGLSGPRSAGHTGFTGTSLVLDPASRSVAVLLTNRVHPTREWGSNNPSREALAQGLAEAIPVRPAQGSQAWFARADAGTRAGRPGGEATLTTDDLGAVAGETRVSFDAFVDTQNDSDGTDPLTVEASTDNGASWHPVSLKATGPGAPEELQHSLAGAGHRAWWKVTGTIPTPPSASNLRLRWRYAPNDQYVGRGVYVDGIRVTNESGAILDGESQPRRLHAQQWTATDR